MALISNRSNKGFPYEEKKGKNPYGHKCSLCQEDEGKTNMDKLHLYYEAPCFNP